MRFKTRRQYFNFLKEKLLEYYYNWENFLGKEHLDFIKKIDKLAKTRSYLCLKKGKKIITLIDLWEYLDFIYCPMDWIEHIWISPDLKKEERLIIHKYIRRWFKNNMKYKFLRAGVHSFNTRSQKFFRKWGLNQNGLLS